MRGFARRYPEAWRSMRPETSGSLELKAGRVQFLQVHPLLASPSDRSEILHLAQPAAAQDYFWYMLISNDPRVLAASHARLSVMVIKGGLVMAFLVLAAASALAYAVARQRALSRSLEQAVDNVPVLIAYIDAESCFRFNNRAYFDIYGITPKSLFGRHVRDIFGEDGYREMLPYLEQALAGQRVEFALFLEQGEGPRDLAITFVPDVAGSGRGVYALITDITQRRVLERREREHRKELAQISRLASVGEITNEIAHQINQPLAAIAMFSHAAQRTLEKGGEPDKLRGWMETINNQAKRASEVVQRLRRFAQQGEIRSAPLDLNHSVREAAALVEIDARGHQIELCLELEDPLPHVMAAGILMDQVIYNLLHNAIRSAAGLGQPGRVMVRSHADASRVWVAVSDQPAVGDMSENEYTIEPGIEQIDLGFEVGLSISRSIVTSYEGDIVCRQNKVGGSQVSFYLPRLES
jgi:PAS domain S-box-containing protein